MHEVWPGHFLQFLHANRAPSKFGQVFVGYAFSEGWAHYAEEMMWDAGLGNGNQEIHIGQLVEALLRNVRFQSGRPLESEGVVRAIAAAEARLGSSGRLVIRPSGTEPVIRVMGEGDNKSLVEDAVDGIVEALTDVAA